MDANEQENGASITFETPEVAIETMASIVKALDEGEGEKLSRMEMMALLSILRSPTKPTVLITRPERVGALHELLRSVAIKGNVVEYHGEIFENISVFTSERFPFGCFRMIPREELSHWIMQKQLPF